MADDLVTFGPVVKHVHLDYEFVKKILGKCGGASGDMTTNCMCKCKLL